MILASAEGLTNAAVAHRKPSASGDGASERHRGPGSATSIPALDGVPRATHPCSRIDMLRPVLHRARQGRPATGRRSCVESTTMRGDPRCRRSMPPTFATARRRSAGRRQSASRASRPPAESSCGRINSASTSERCAGIAGLVPQRARVRQLHAILDRWRVLRCRISGTGTLARPRQGRRRAAARSTPTDMQPTRHAILRGGGRPASSSAVLR